MDIFNWDYLNVPLSSKYITTMVVFKSHRSSNSAIWEFRNKIKAFFS